ncbi:heme-dependent oxidative N-demethylase subunit alpha family protein [Pannonibacter sp. Pt2-lr]
MFRYTPYDGSKRPFSIGLEPVPQERWFDPDERFAEQLARKRELMDAMADVVIHSEPETLAAQAEAFGLVAAHLPVAHPDLYRAEGGGIALQADGTVCHMTPDEPPLQTISRAVQEDLVLMRKGGWLAAGCGLALFPVLLVAGGQGLKTDG